MADTTAYEVGIPWHLRAVHTATTLTVLATLAAIILEIHTHTQRGVRDILVSHGFT